MLSLNVHHQISEIPADLWNRLCGTHYPFLRHEFLHALESTHCVSPEQGWQPLHLSIEKAGETVAVMPLYLKNHSWGEYVFDWAWADAWQRHGLDYYPKLLTAIPFTPAQGPRLGHSIPLDELVPALTSGLQQLCQSLGASSWHGLFVEPELRQQLVTHQQFSRLGCQYHWFNNNYPDFDAFLATFTSRKRKNLRKERQKVVDQGVTLTTLNGHEITDAQLVHFYRFYQMTYLKRGRQGYLTPEFFHQLRQTMPEQLVLVLAHVGEQPVAGALSLRSDTTLYGRYWGCLDEFDSLHFETCYYQGIEYCIAQGLQRFDPGAQGEHKIQRGFKPVETWSCHWVAEPGFRPAVKQFLAEEQQAMQQQISELTTWLPFRNDT
ncbi:MAG: GNAT family N-acetyltransferase [Marinobacterium sp.]|nr:GNAT family N-acetyltransferase [Marinobacterium sp.]